MAKLIKYMDGQKWELEIPDNDIARIWPCGEQVEVMRHSNPKNIVCDRIDFSKK